MTCKFIGTEAEVGGTRLHKLGQPITMEDRDAEQMILGGGSEQAFAGAIAMLPEGLFEKIGLTEEELEKYSTPGARQQALSGASGKHDEFRRKYTAALETLHEFRLTLEPKDQEGAE